MPPTLVFCCGGECGITQIGSATAGVRHWTAVTGTPTVATARARIGATRSYRFVPTVGSSENLQKTLATPTVAVMRAYVWFDQLPDADCRIMGFVPAAGTDT